MKIDVLGTKYTIIKSDPSKYPLLNNADGYCDKTTKKIVVYKNPPPDCELDDWEEYAKKVLRHEIIHAFLFESGLHGCANWGAFESEHSEQMVDWIAVQFPKLQKAFEKTNCI